MSLSDHRKVDSILAHIHAVERNLVRVAKELLTPNKTLALELLQRARSHDLSKFTEFEFDNLWPGPSFNDALSLHHTKNRHHPEHHPNGVSDMSEADLIEMACDWAARGQEFGTDVRAWAFESGIAKFGFERDSAAGTTISNALNILLPEPFKQN